MSLTTYRDGDEWVSVTADLLREGDTIHLDGRAGVVWGVEPASEQVTLFIHDCLGGGEFKQEHLREPLTIHGKNPVWLVAFDARVTGRG